MSDEYTNLDLDTADELLIAAGQPAIAKALRYQTQGNRNLIQGEWGMKVVEAFEHILQERVVAVLADVQTSLDKQIGLVQQVLTAHKENARGLKKHGRQIAALTRRVTALEENNMRLAALEAAIALLRAGVTMPGATQQDGD